MTEVSYNTKKYFRQDVLNFENEVIMLESKKVLEVEEATTATLNISVEANPRATIRWQLNGTDIILNDRVTQTDDGNLIILKLSFDDTGIYTAFADNGLGEAASVSLELKVQPSRMDIQVELCNLTNLTT